jgi:hypothetical protein
VKRSPNELLCGTYCFIYFIYFIYGHTAFGVLFFLPAFTSSSEQARKKRRPLPLLLRAPAQRYP